MWGLATLSDRLPAIAASYCYDAVLLQREMMSSFATIERLTKAPRILDVDDAIFLLNSGSAARKIASMSELVICGNDYLADWFSKWNKNIQIIPTAIDTNRFVPTAQTTLTRETVTLGWIGTSGNHPFLLDIERPLQQILSSNKSARLKVVSDSSPQFKHLSADLVDFSYWSESEEIKAIQAIDIGLMPLQDSAWARGKCSFKMLQYMATGLPVVVSPVGMNADVLRLGEMGFGATTEVEWVERLTELLYNPSLRIQLGNVGRHIAVSQFSIEAIVPRLARCLTT